MVGLMVNLNRIVNLAIGKAILTKTESLLAFLNYFYNKQ